MVIMRAHLELLPLQTLCAHIFGGLAREALELGGGRLPVGIKWKRNELQPYLDLEDLQETGGPVYIEIRPSDFDGLSVKKTMMALESLVIAAFEHLGSCYQIARRVGLKDEYQARRMLRRCGRIKALLRRAGFDVPALMTRIRARGDQG